MLDSYEHLSRLKHDAELAALEALEAEEKLKQVKLDVEYSKYLTKKYQENFDELITLIKKRFLDE